MPCRPLRLFRPCRPAQDAWVFDPDHEEPTHCTRDRLTLTGLAEDLFGGCVERRPQRCPSDLVSARRVAGRDGWQMPFVRDGGEHSRPETIVLDDATNCVLLRQLDDPPVTSRTGKEHHTSRISEWTSLFVGETLDPALFTWAGPAREYADGSAEFLQREEADRRARVEWFAANVAVLPLSVTLRVADVTVHEYAEDGSFFATVGDNTGIVLTRRPASDEPWDVRWDRVDHRWRDDRWDWALSASFDPIDRDAVHDLQRQLGSSPR